DDLKFEIPKRVAEVYRARGFEVLTIDGARIHTDEGWALVRASNTQPKLVLRVEASSPRRRDAMLAELEEVLSEVEASLRS
ncbi:MAG: phosphomannomutase, partial [Myxococcota bacterium]